MTDTRSQPTTEVRRLKKLLAFIAKRSDVSDNAGGDITGWAAMLYARMQDIHRAALEPEKPL